MALLRDGFSTTIVGTGAGVGVFGVTLLEKEIQPFGYDMGGPIETTNMRNSTWRTRAPKTLFDVEPVTIICLYDPAALGPVGAIGIMAGINLVWTITFPDGTTRAFTGYVDKITPQNMKEGDLPLCEVKIIPTNRAGARAAPAGAESGPT